MIQKGRILAVDDEDGITEYLQDLFETAGYDVQTASGGWQAWEQICSETFDFVMTDVRMERGDGIELVEKVRDMPNPKPVIAIMSAFTDVLISDVYERGAVAFISKPAKSNLLVNTVKKALTSDAEKWLDLSDRPNAAFIELSFDSAVDAVRLGLIGFGKGGLFLNLTSGFPFEEQPIRFKLDFNTGSVKSFQGQGIVKWVRRTSSRYFYQGAGIEFIGLNQESKAYVLNHNMANMPTSYIPVGVIPPEAKK